MPIVLKLNQTEVIVIEIPVKIQKKEINYAPFYNNRPTPC